MASKAKVIRENDPYVLPSNNAELQAFVNKYKIDMTEQVVSSIDFAVTHRLPIIEVFQFKDSKFVVTISSPEFEVNLETIYKFYLESEHYELCGRVAKLQKKLKKIPNEKKKK